MISEIETIHHRADDAVLRELWAAKDQLSAASGHDIHAFIAGLRERQALSGRRVVNLDPADVPLTPSDTPASY